MAGRKSRYLVALPGLRRRAGRFADDTEGASLVEFAFMFPILLCVLFMIITLSHMMMIDRKVNRTAQATADLIAQYQAVNQVTMQNIKTAAELMMQPFATDFDISVAHVPFDDVTGDPAMASAAGWRAQFKGADQIDDDEANAAAAGSHVLKPPSETESTGALGMPGDALILVRMNYRYQAMWLSDFTLPVVDLTFPSQLTFSKETYARPRLIRQIAADQPSYTVP